MMLGDGSDTVRLGRPSGLGPRPSKGPARRRGGGMEASDQPPGRRPSPGTRLRCVIRINTETGLTTRRGGGPPGGARLAAHRILVGALRIREPAEDTPGRLPDSASRVRIKHVAARGAAIEMESFHAAYPLGRPTPPPELALLLGQRQGGRPQGQAAWADPIRCWHQGWKLQGAARTCLSLV
ncbi:hypothetical protein GGTG_08049 [Gaeumannomyces tritici R3-111a-1]|uniref:Uncharacterized protein n=1 Tax=Gaeumannomyces tritici (strain R3-111a-1) TaxID=644352 RepID=J3P3G3_GAET3|nr:hypothetical protein GGTG_08049 [Gaeumannomyces tritici R3-111a-1]EJT74205.1 hypothetical protein GGTG_08049 [Gaeumannomyces tritici R3-111a-1]